MDWSQDKFTHRCEVTTTLGHEFSGVVSAAGTKAARALPAGTRIGVDPNRGCFACEFCSRGNPHYCRNRDTCGAIGVARDGAFARFAVANMVQVTKLPDDMPFELGNYICR